MNKITIPYPFIRVRTSVCDEDGIHDIESWAPGVRFEALSVDDSITLADGMGSQIVEVVSRHKPSPKYPERVFYTRFWKSPDGRTFGKPGLHIKTASAFDRLCKGYRYPFVLDGDEVARKAWMRGPF